MAKPVVRCFSAIVYADGHVWGDIHLVSLETAQWMQQMGYTVIGPDPYDLIELNAWEKAQPTHWPWS